VSYKLSFVIGPARYVDAIVPNKRMNKGDSLVSVSIQNVYELRSELVQFGAT